MLLRGTPYLNIDTDIEIGIGIEIHIDIDIDVDNILLGGCQRVNILSGK